MTRLPALLLVLCGCASVDFEPVARMREGTTMTQRQIGIAWDKPETGPEPTSYIVRRDGDYVTMTDGTEVTIADDPSEHNLTVASVANGMESVDSLPLYRSFAITGLDIRDNGVVVKFACEPNTEYWLEVSRDEGKTWTEVAEILTGPDQREAGIGGDPLVGSEEWYRVWKRL